MEGFVASFSPPRFVMRPRPHLADEMSAVAVAVAVAAVAAVDFFAGFFASVWPDRARCSAQNGASFGILDENRDNDCSGPGVQQQYCGLYVGVALILDVVVLLVPYGEYCFSPVSVGPMPLPTRVVVVAAAVAGVALILEKAFPVVTLDHPWHDGWTTPSRSRGIVTATDLCLWNYYCSCYYYY